MRSAKRALLPEGQGIKKGALQERLCVVSCKTTENKIGGIIISDDHDRRHSRRRIHRHRGYHHHF